MATDNCTIGYTDRKKLLARGDIEDYRKAALKKLLIKIEDVRKDQVDEANKRKERKQRRKDEIILDEKRVIATKTSKPKKNKHKAVKQDDLWNQRWQAYMDYMKKNQFCPSRYYTEDMVLFSWFKHNKMLLSKGKMREYRIAKFKQLLDEVKELQPQNNVIRNADKGKGYYTRARQRNWFEMCERYSKYLDDNKKIPKQISSAVQDRLWRLLATWPLGVFRYRLFRLYLSTDSASMLNLPMTINSVMTIRKNRKS